MFMLIVILMVNIGLINKITNQEKEIAQITKNYNVTDNEMEQAYIEATEGKDKYITFREVEELVNTAKEEAKNEAKNEAKKEVKNEIYPVGSIYISTNSTNPSQIIGGTWQAYGEGRTLVGVGTGTDSNNTKQTFSNGGTGGEYTHKLIVNEIPSHNHAFTTGGVPMVINANTSHAEIDPSLGYSMATNGYFNSMKKNVSSIANTGGSQFHNNVQPYIVTYIWKRIN